MVMVMEITVRLVATEITVGLAVTVSTAPVRVLSVWVAADSAASMDESKLIVFDTIYVAG